MRPQVHWIDTCVVGRLAIMPRPRAGDWLDDEICGWRNENIDIIVSLLELEEVYELNLEREADLCLKYGIEFISFPIADRSVPNSARDTARLVSRLAHCLKNDKAVAIHCRAGIGRSSLIAACVLASSGCDPNVVFDLISKSRGLRVPDTEPQEEWFGQFAHQYNSTTSQRPKLD